MTPPPYFETTAGPRAERLLGALAASCALHALLALLIYFDVVGLGGGFGLGIGPGLGIGAGGGAGLGEKRRDIYALKDLPAPAPPSDPEAEKLLQELLRPARPDAVVLPRPEAPKTTPSPVVRFAAPPKPIGAGTDLGSRFASAGAGVGGFGGGGGGGSGLSLGSSFGRYVGSLRKVGLDVALVIDATGSMQDVVDELKTRLLDLTRTMQSLVPTARIGAVTYRDRDEGESTGGPRQSEGFVVRWTDLTFNGKKVAAFLDGIVAEGGGDWEEAVKDGVQTAMRQFKWRADAKKVIIIVGSSPPHPKDVPALKQLIQEWRTKNGVINTIDVSWPLHVEHEKKTYKWLHDEELKEVSPLPDFYKELQQSFTDIAKTGGGEMVALESNDALVRALLVQTFGPQWQKDMGRVARGL
jgi:hypothetical protein